MSAHGHGFDGVERRGLMFVLSSPSGAGKTTLSRLLIERTPGLKMSVSATTRPMRPGEVDGRDYRFIDKTEFEAMAKRGDLLQGAVIVVRFTSPIAGVIRVQAQHFKGRQPRKLDFDIDNTRKAPGVTSTRDATSASFTSVPTTSGKSSRLPPPPPGCRPNYGRPWPRRPQPAPRPSWRLRSQA